MQIVTQSLGQAVSGDHPPYPVAGGPAESLNRLAPEPSR
jgi:hypothetical protein